ncbi:MAG: VPLPA-CTERM sorting domain-containing protein [Phycisphaerales bacterium]|nr:VPLPA-CTERM sorting domain-containing protein [Phycisphaerales bacterium]
MKTTTLITIGAASVALSACPAATAATTFFFNANQSYVNSGSSPYAGSVQLENFEDGVLNLAGVTANGGKVKGSGSKTDSVDGDDGNINGLGNQGHSFTSGNKKSITFHFSGQGNAMPTMAGVVWTDGKHDSTVTFKAWDKNGDFIGKIKVTLGDLVKTGTTGEDHFLGLTSNKGISKIQIASNYAGFEIDHLQFGYALGLSAVPLPPAVAMGLAGLAGVAMMGRRRRAAA